MTTTPDPLVFETGDLGDVLGLLGVLLGFRPRDSLVVIALTGQRCRTTFQIRCDLPEPTEAPGVARFIGHHLAQHGAESVLAFAVDADAERCDAAIAAVFADCAIRGLPVAGAARADQGWYRTYDERGEPSNDPPRRYDAENSPQTVEAVIHGAAVAPSRAIMLAAFDPPGPERVAVLVPCFEQAAAEVAAFREKHDREAFAERGLAVHDRLRASGEPLSDADAARLTAWISADIAIRDGAWRRLTRETAVADLAFWGQIVTRAIPPFAPAALCLCGVAAWLQGNGAIARHVWERAHHADPQYTMASLLLEALARGMRPQALAAVMETPISARAEECGGLQ